MITGSGETEVALNNLRTTLPQMMGFGLVKGDRPR